MSNETRINQQHEQAMQLAEEAFFAKRSKEIEKAKELYTSAFRLEREAALALVSDYEQEPTRSVLFQGAATLALASEQELEAERMIRFALLGNPPKQIKQELYELLEELQEKKAVLSPLDKYQQLPQNLQKEVADFIDLLIMKHKGVTASL
ncbi:MAG: hypothetical protein AAF806_24865 [Bacteroidota bacterium]